jgi:hypothetical protein
LGTDFVINTAGKYFINFGLVTQAGNKIAALAVKRGGTTTMIDDSILNVGAGNITTTISVILELEAGDVLTMINAAPLPPPPTSFTLAGVPGVDTATTAFVVILRVQ